MFEKDDDFFKNTKKRGLSFHKKCGSSALFFVFLQACKAVSFIYKPLYLRTTVSMVSMSTLVSRASEKC